MTKVALNNRFNERTVMFLSMIFNLLFEHQSRQSLLSVQLATEIPFAYVRILDGTTVTPPDHCKETYPGTVGAGDKFQIKFDYQTGRFLYVELQSGKAGDSPSGMERLHNVQKNDLILRDLGYYKYDMLRKIGEKQVYYVLRARSDTMFYTDQPVS